MFNTSDCSVGDLVVGTVLVKRCVDLAGTEDYALDLLWSINGFAVFGIFNDPLNWVSPVNSSMFERAIG